MLSSGAELKPQNTRSLVGTLILEVILFYLHNTNGRILLFSYWYVVFSLLLILSKDSLLSSTFLNALASNMHKTFSLKQVSYLAKPNECVTKQC